MAPVQQFSWCPSCSVFVFLRFQEFKDVHMAISNQTVERCIEECLQCLRWCSECRDESLTEDPVMMKECIRLCGECLELCRTCVALLAGSSPFAHRVCGVCAELCEACAAECGKYEG